MQIPSGPQASTSFFVTAVPKPSPPPPPQNPPPSSTPPPTIFPVVFRLVIQPVSTLPTLSAASRPFLFGLNDAIAGLESPLVPSSAEVAYSATAERLDVKPFGNMSPDPDVRLIFKYAIWNGQELQLPASLRLDAPSELTIGMTPAYRVTLKSPLGMAAFVSDGEAAPGFVLHGSTVQYRVVDQTEPMHGLWGFLGGTQHFQAFVDEHGGKVAASEVIRGPVYRLAVWDSDFGLPALALVGLGIFLLIAAPGPTPGAAALVIGSGKGIAKPHEEATRW